MQSTDVLAKQLFDKYGEDRAWIEEVRKIRDTLVQKGSTSEKFTSISKTESTSSHEDFVFLYMLAKEYGSDPIVEIGTWYGASAAVMAHATGGAVTSCDKHNVFVDDEYTKNVEFHNCYSKDFLSKLRQCKIKTRFVFVDGRLKRDDGKKLLKTYSTGKVLFVCHDWNLDKGRENVKEMSKRLKNSTVYVPDLKNRCEIGGVKINCCVAVVMGEVV